MRLQQLLGLLTLLISLNLSAQKAPDFKITTTDDKEINLYTDFLDQGKAVVIELFFVDCPSCKTFAPFISSLHKKMVEREIAVEFVSLSVVSYDTDETVEEFKRTYDHDWHFAHAGRGSLEASAPYTDGTYGTYFGAPTVVVISPDGTVNYIRRVFGNNDEYIDNIETAIIDAQTAFNENGPPTAIITGGINTIDGEGLGGVSAKFTGAVDTTIISDANGFFQTGSLVAAENYTLSLEKNSNPVNGVTTLDIVIISKHILGIDTFSTDYQHIAADVNRSGAVTTFDLVQIRQLILGINDSFSNAPSWVFDPAEVNLTSLTELGNLSFTGIKIGDLNGSADPNGLLETEERGHQETFALSIIDQAFDAGAPVLLTLNAADLQKIQGYQFSLAFDTDILALDQTIDENQLSQLYGGHYNLQLKDRGLLATSWNTEKEQLNSLLFTLPFRAKKSGTLSEAISINSSFIPMEAFDFKEQLLDVSLTFEPIIEQSLDNEMTLFPNPSKTTEVFVDYKAENTENITIKVINSIGQVMHTQAYEVVQGFQTLKLPVANLSAGIYKIQIRTDKNRLKTLPLIKH